MSFRLGGGCVAWAVCSAKKRQRLRRVAAVASGIGKLFWDCHVTRFILREVLSALNDKRKREGGRKDRKEVEKG